VHAEAGLTRGEVRGLALRGAQDIEVVALNVVGSVVGLGVSAHEPSLLSLPAEADGRALRHICLISAGSKPRLRHQCLTADKRGPPLRLWPPRRSAGRKER